MAVDGREERKVNKITVVILASSSDGSLDLMTRLNGEPLLARTIDLIRSLPGNITCYGFAADKRHRNYMTRRGIDCSPTPIVTHRKNFPRLVSGVVPVLQSEGREIRGTLSLLDPHYPFLDRNDIARAQKYMHDRKCGGLMAVVKSRRTPYHTLVESNGTVDFFTRKSHLTRVPMRQEAELFYLPAGMMLVAPSHLDPDGTLRTLDDAMCGWEVDEYKGLDVREKTDLALAHKLLHARDDRGHR
ncbi:MAG: hypothetical protein A2Z34_11340 [Planctomycetes bacterium RBG_16_59_8]|nr:MAG: hypothetical protein A2Z34_11340 [Planctomycetes bacterium RBG_16_59_8]